MLMLAMAQGAEWIRLQASRVHPAAGGLCMAALFVVPAWAFVQTPPPYWVEDHKTVFAFFRQHRRPGDAVFVFPYEVQAVERYGSAYGLAPDDILIGHRRQTAGLPPGTSTAIAVARVCFRWVRSGVGTAARGLSSTIGVRKESIAIPSEKPLDQSGPLDLSDPARSRRRRRNVSWRRRTCRRAATTARPSGRAGAEPRPKKTVPRAVPSDVHGAIDAVWRIGSPL
jgi:hypothetical protein